MLKTDMIIRAAISSRRSALLLLCMFAGGGANGTVDAVAAPVRIVEDGRAEAVVLTSAEPTRTTEYAVAELIDHIEQATGVKLPVRREGEVVEGYASRIYVGPTQAADRIGLDADALPPDVYRLRAHEGDLYVLGREDAGFDRVFPEMTEDPDAYYGAFSSVLVPPGNLARHRSAPRGTLFGVYELLERFAGVRWVWPGDLGTHVPKTDKLRIDGSLDMRKGPDLGFRSLGWNQMGLAAFRGGARSDLEMRLGYDGETLKQYGRDLMVFLARQRTGASVARPRPLHVPDHLNWWGQFGDEHPEWFMLREDGERGPKGGSGKTSLSVAEPSLHRYIVEDYWDGGDLLKIGDSDIRSYCQSDYSRAWDSPQPDNPPLQSVSKNYEPQVVSTRYARFWMTLHNMAKRRNPDVTISAYLYWNTLPAPTGEIREHGLLEGKNIYGEFTPWTGPTMTYPMSGEADRWLREQWAGWKEAGARLAYRPNALYINGHGMPWLSVRQSGEFLRYTIRNGSEGAHLGSNSIGNWSARGPMLYTLMRLMWNADHTPRQAMDYYLDAFGPAKEAVREYFNDWERLSEKRHWSTRPNLSNLGRLYSQRVFEEAEKSLEEAERAVEKSGRDSYARRVAFLRHGFEHARLMARFSSALKAGEVPLEDRTAFERAAAALRALIEFRERHASSYFVDLYKLPRTEAGIDGLAKLFEPFESVRRERLPNELSDPWGDWRFRKDPANIGVEREWHRSMPPPADSLAIAVPSHWSSTQVAGYLGYGWYWVEFKIPGEWEGHPVALRFGAVDEQAWVYVNGEQIGEHSLDSESEFKTIGDLWNEPFTVRVPPERLNYGGANLLAVRVHASRDNGGIWKPVTIYRPKDDTGK